MKVTILLFLFSFTMYHMSNTVFLEDFTLFVSKKVFIKSINRSWMFCLVIHVKPIDIG